MNRGDRREPLFKDDAARQGAEEDAGYKPIRRGWFFGEAELKQELLGQMSERLRRQH